MFCDGILLVGVQMPSANPMTKFVVAKVIVTKRITKSFPGQSFPEGGSPSREWEGLAFKQI